MCVFVCMCTCTWYVFVRVFVHIYACLFFDHVYRVHDVCISLIFLFFQFCRAFPAQCTYSLVSLGTRTRAEGSRVLHVDCRRPPVAAADRPCLAASVSSMSHSRRVPSLNLSHCGWRFGAPVELKSCRARISMCARRSRMAVWRAWLI